MRVSCSSCGATFLVSTALVAGKKVRFRCKSCRSAFTVDGTTMDAETVGVEGDAQPLSILPPSVEPPPVEPVSAETLGGDAVDDDPLRSSWRPRIEIPDEAPTRVAPGRGEGAVSSQDGAAPTPFGPPVDLAPPAPASDGLPHLPFGLGAARSNGEAHHDTPTTRLEVGRRGAAEPDDATPTVPLDLKSAEQPLPLLRRSRPPPPGPAPEPAAPRPKSVPPPLPPAYVRQYAEDDPTVEIREDEVELRADVPEVTPTRRERLDDLVELLTLAGSPPAGDLAQPPARSDPALASGGVDEPAPSSRRERMRDLQALKSTHPPPGETTASSAPEGASSDELVSMGGGGLLIASDVLTRAAEVAERADAVSTKPGDGARRESGAAWKWVAVVAVIVAAGSVYVAMESRRRPPETAPVVAGNDTRPPPGPAVPTGTAARADPPAETAPAGPIGAATAASTAAATSTLTPISAAAATSTEPQGRAARPTPEDTAPTAAATETASPPATAAASQGPDLRAAPEASPPAAAASPPADADPGAAPPPAGGEFAAEFDRAAATAALGAAASAAQGCRTDQPGTVRVSVTFLPNGRVSAANVDGPPFAGTPTGGCIASKFRTAQVPAFRGGPVTVHKSVTIQ